MGAVDFLRSCAERLISERPEVVEVVLFGSLADGTAVPGSDADVMIVLEKSSQRRWFDRIDDYVDYFIDIDIGVDIFPYTVDELRSVPLARTACRTGKVLARRKGKATDIMT